MCWRTYFLRRMESLAKGTHYNICACARKETTEGWKKTRRYGRVLYDIRVLTCLTSGSRHVRHPGLGMHDTRVSDTRKRHTHLITIFGLSIHQACRSLNLSRTVYHYRPDTTCDEPVIAAPQAAAERYPRYGFPKLFQILRQQGYSWNHKRLHRIYCLLKLNFRRKGKQRLLVRNPSPLATSEALN